MRRLPKAFWAGFVFAAIGAALWTVVLGSAFVAFHCERPWGRILVTSGVVTFQRTSSPAAPGPFNWVTPRPDRTECVPQRPTLRWTVPAEVPAERRARPYFDIDIDMNPGPIPGSWGDTFTPVVSAWLGMIRIERVPWDTITEFVIWPVAMLPSIIGVPLMIRGARQRRRSLAGHCLACGYDLSALAAGSPCPECGRSTLKVGRHRAITSPTKDTAQSAPSRSPCPAPRASPQGPGSRPSP